MADFFVSYNAADEAKAEWIAWQLREAGFSVRFAKWELREGNIAAWMREALDDSDRLIAVCSPEYFAEKAAYSAMEREAFLWTSPKQFGGTIIPVVVRDVAMPKLYAPFMRINLTGVEAEEARERLIGAVSVAAQPMPPAFAPEPLAFQQVPQSAADVAVSPNQSYAGWPGLVALSALGYAIWADQRGDGKLVGDLWGASPGPGCPSSSCCCTV